MPVVVDQVAMERLHRCGAEPDIPVERSWRRLWFFEANAPPRLGAVAFAHQQLAIFAALHGGDHLGFAVAAAVLRAVLHDTVVLLGRFDALATFEHVVANRLFNIHILAGLAGPNGNQRVPVIGGGNGDRVEVFVFECFAHIFHRGGTVAAPLFDIDRATIVQIAIGIDEIGDLHPFAPGEFANVRAAAAVDAGDADANHVIRPADLPGGFGAGDGEERERGAGGRAGLQEAAARESLHDLTPEEGGREETAPHYNIPRPARPLKTLPVTPRNTKAASVLRRRSRPVTFSK